MVGCFGLASHLPRLASFFPSSFEHWFWGRAHLRLCPCRRYTFPRDAAPWRRHLASARSCFLRKPTVFTPSAYRQIRQILPPSPAIISVLAYLLVFARVTISELMASPAQSGCSVGALWLGLQGSCQRNGAPPPPQRSPGRGSCTC